MIQGHVRTIDRDQRKAIVRTEYDDLIVLRILDGTKVDVGDMIVGQLDCQGKNFVLDHSKRVGVQVYIENGRRLFTSGRKGHSGRHASRSVQFLRRKVA